MPAHAQKESSRSHNAPKGSARTRRNPSSEDQTRKGRAERLVASSAPAPVAPGEPVPEPRAAAALARVQPRLDEMKPEDYVQISLDIPQAASLALGILPGLRGLRAEIIEKLPCHDLDSLDGLEEYALAAWYAHLQWLGENDPGSPLKVLMEEAVPLRANLLGDAEALARRGLLDAQRVAEIRAGQGQIDMANDLVELSSLMLASWARIQNKTAATEEEVRRAGDLGPLLLAALGVRDHGAPPPTGDAADRRARAFSLFARAYDQIRRAVIYLRWDEGDADVIAPSLYKGRGGRPRAEAAPADAKPADAAPADAEPADAKAADGKPAEAKAAEAKPADAKPAEAKPADAKPAEGPAAKPSAAPASKPS